MTDEGDIREMLSPEAKLYIGAKIHGLEIVEFLSEGGMGLIFKAVSTSGAVKVERAVKLIKPELAANPGVRARFTREADMASRLGEHPNIVAVFYSGIATHEPFNRTVTDEDEPVGIPYMIMPLISGVTLNQEMERVGRYKERDAVLILAQIGKALMEAHDRGIVHRDVKPENVFVSHFGGATSVKLADFGIACYVNAADRPNTDVGGKLTQKGMVVGSPEFMAPEMFISPGVGDGTTRHIDQRVDIYAFGVMAYDMVTDKVPFVFSGVDLITKYIARVMSEPPPDVMDHNPAISRDFADVIMHCLGKKPEDRPSSMREVLEDMAIATGIDVHMTIRPASMAEELGDGEIDVLVEQLRPPPAPSGLLGEGDEGEVIIMHSSIRPDPANNGRGSAPSGRNSPVARLLGSALGAALALLAIVGVVVGYLHYYHGMRIQIGTPGESTDQTASRTQDPLPDGQDPPVDRSDRPESTVEDAQPEESPTEPEPPQNGVTVVTRPEQQPGETSPIVPRPPTNSTQSELDGQYMNCVNTRLSRTVRLQACTQYTQDAPRNTIYWSTAHFWKLELTAQNARQQRRHRPRPEPETNEEDQSVEGEATPPTDSTEEGQ